MRILVVAPSLFMPWADYVARALIGLGQSPAIFYYSDIWVDRLTARRGRSWANSIPPLAKGLDRWRVRWLAGRDDRLLKTARSFRPDLLLILRGEALSATVLQALKDQAGCPLATWWQDDPFRFTVSEMLPLYDLFFVFDRSYMKRLSAEGAQRVEFLPCSCDPSVYYRRSLNRRETARYQSDISLIAWYYPHRAQLIRALSGLNLKIWGRGWQSPEARMALNGTGERLLPRERFVTDEEAAKIYSAAKIGLNIHSDQTREGGLNTRTFELLATGTFELTDAVPGMEELLEPGREIAVYHSAEEARALAERYLRQPQEREAIAARGRTRVLQEHTYEQRMKHLLECLTT